MLELWKKLWIKFFLTSRDQHWTVRLEQDSVSYLGNLNVDFETRNCYGIQKQLQLHILMKNVHLLIYYNNEQNGVYLQTEKGKDNFLNKV